MPKLKIQSIQHKQLINTTLKTINKINIHNTTITQITHHTNISTKIINHYFKNKNNLLKTTIHNITNQLHNTILNQLHTLPQNNTKLQLQTIINKNFNKTQINNTTIKT